MMPWTDHGAAYWMSDFVLWGSLVVMPALFLVVMGWAGMKAQGFLLAGFAVGGALGGASGSIGGQSGSGLGGAVGGAANKAGALQ